MTKVKYFIAVFAVMILMLIFPNIVSAATINATETTTTSTGKVVNWSYELDSNNNIINLKCTNISAVSGELEIPSTIDGYTVLTIGNARNTWDGDGAFENCSGLTGVTIPNTVTYIGHRAFYNCPGLKTLTIPNSVTGMGEGTFEGCVGITSVTLSETLSSISKAAFKDCKGLKSIALPESINSIGEAAFERCSGIAELIIPNNVTSMGENAFKGCSGLKKLTLSSNITEIKNNVFRDCSGLTSVILPDSVTTIAGGYIWEGAFGGCSNLEKILIPDSVVSIGVNAFIDCDKLTIYGNDGMTSKEYAEENGINFKYISEWDDADVGDDITPPTVENLYVDYSSVSGYPSESNFCYVSTGKSITIEFEFSELITGKTAPTLTLKCGTGENVEVSNGVIGGQKIVYTYTIKEGDEGIVTAVSLSGGDVTDIAGNQAQLSCPKELKIQWTGDYVYANGIATDVDGDKNPDNGDSSNDETNGGTDKDGSTQKPTTDDKKDTTTAPTILPAAGINMAIISIIIGAIIVSIITIKKYNSYRDIK